MKKSQTTNQQEHTRLELGLDMFMNDQTIQLRFEHQDFMLQYIQQQQQKTSQIVDNIMLDYFKQRYEGICYKGLFIQDIQEIVNRNAIRVEETREGQLTYICECWLKIKTIDIQPFTILNCKIEEYHRQHDQLEIMAKRGNIKVFLSEHMPKVISSLQQEQIVPCVIHQIVYPTGKPFCVAFGNFYKSMNIKQVFKVTGIEKDLQQIIQFDRIKNLRQQILSLKKTDIKVFCQLFGQTQNDTQQSNSQQIENVIQNLENNTIIQIDLYQLVMGEISLSNDQNMDLSEYLVSEGNNVEILQKILLSMEKWMILLIEYIELKKDNQNINLIKEIVECAQ